MHLRASRKGIERVSRGITGEDKEMTLTDTILLGLVMLLGEEGKHYVIFERDIDEWKIVGYLRRN